MALVLAELVAEEHRHTEGDYATSIATGDAFESRSESRGAFPCQN